MPRKRKRRRRQPRKVPYARSSMRSKRVELKFYEENNNNSFQSAAVTGTMWSVSLVNIAQGLDEAQRIGRMINVKEIRLRMLFTIPSTLNSNAAHDNIRVIVFRDRQASIDALNVSPTSLLAAPVNVLSFKNLFNQTRFTFLYDRTFAIAAPSANDSNFAQKDYIRTCVMKMNDQVQYFNETGTTNTITSINYGIMCISSNVQCTLSINSRVRYTDQ